jgi:hypothetical protein
VKNDHPLAPFQPKLDNQGVLRINSRLRAAKDLPQPILLPQKHEFTDLVIKRTHYNQLEHVGGTNHTLSVIHSKFWIIRGRSAVRKTLRKCIKCRRVHAKFADQMMGPLPEFRLPEKERLAAFTNVIVDMAGPFLVVQKRSRVKRYIIIFRCLNYGCLHCEITDLQDTESFLMAFARFTARRGCPKFVRSDNGGNFVRGNEELLAQWKQIDQEKLQTKFHQIKWEFSSPHEPSTNGAIEIMVRAVKRALKKVVQPGCLNEEGFTTMVVKAEGILNSRPLTYTSSDSGDLTPITPNDFLLPSCLRDCTELPEEGGKFSRRLRQINEILNAFWSRYVKEYIPTLHSTQKWLKPQRDFKVGDVVLYYDQDQRGNWPMGRVEEVYPNPSDQKTRQVLIKTAKFAGQKNYKSEYLRRHIRGLVLLLPEDQFENE